jgi:hypothetical protein
MNDLRGAFRVLQVVQTVKTDTFTATVGTTPTDITGMSVTITPSATSSLVLIVANASITAQSGVTMGYRLVRGSTAIFIGDTAGSRRTLSSGQATSLANNAINIPSVFMDTPNTTSATTYKLQAAGDQVGAIVYLNRGFTDTDTAGFARTASSLIAMEISA